MNGFSISLVIPIHREQPKQIWATCLRSVLEAEPAPAEIILVADGEMVELGNSIGDTSRLALLETHERKGPAHTRNLGAAKATGDLLCFIDSDIAIPKHLFRQVKKEFAENPDLTAIFGSYDDRPSQIGFFSQYRNLLHHFVHQTSSERASTFWSGCGAVHREAFLEVGGFDAEKYPAPSIEDIELGYRLTGKGHRIKLCKHIQVKHLKKWTMWNMVQVDFSKRALPWTKLILKNRAFINDLNVKWQDRVSVALVFLFGIGCLLICLSPLFGLSALLSIGIFLIINKELFRFFYKKRGGVFALKVIPWQGVFYFICGLAFLVGNIEHLLYRENG